MTSKSNNQYRLNDILVDLIHQPTHTIDLHDDSPYCRPGKRVSDVIVSTVLKPTKRLRSGDNNNNNNPLSTTIRITNEERRASLYADESYVTSLDDETKNIIENNKNRQGDKRTTTEPAPKLTFNEPTTNSPPELVSRLQGILDAYLPRSLHDGVPTRQMSSDEHRTTKLQQQQQQQRTKTIDRHTSNISTIPSRVQEMRRLYLYGLQYVSELQDLQKAPDAILPGNFIEPSTLK